MALGYYDEGALNSQSQKRLRFARFSSSDEICTLFAYIPLSLEATGTRLYCFSQRGTEKWEFTPGYDVSDSEQAYGPIFTIADFHVCALEAGGRPHILVTSHHYSSQPNQFAVLDENGRRLREYWHSGQLYLMETTDLDHDGAVEVLLGGVNNGYGSAILVVLDPRQCSGALVQRPNDPLALKGFQPGNEKAALLFPRTCINRRKGWYNMVHSINVHDGTLEVATSETNDYSGASVTYNFDSSLRLRTVSVSDAYKIQHQELRRLGELDHDFTEDEERALGKSLIWLRRWDQTPLQTGGSGPATDSKPRN
jgi:hypothetical protein